MKQVETCQGPFWVWDRDHLGQVILAGAFWDAQLLPYYQAAADRAPGSWALDLGASIGFHTVWLATRFAHVLAVEAHPDTYALLQRNLQDHGVENVQSHQVAAYDQDVPLVLAAAEVVGWEVPADLNQTPNASSVAYTVQGSRYAGTSTVVVQGCCVDTLVPADAHVGLLKTDVQGCDLRALRGLRATIDRCRPVIVTEHEGVASIHGDTLDDLIAFLTQRQYTVVSIQGGDYVAWPEPQ